MSRRVRLSLILPLVGVFVSGCYNRSYVHEPKFMPVTLGSVPLDVEDQLLQSINDSAEACRESFDSASKDSYDADVREYYSGLTGSLVTLTFGTVAGGASGLTALGGQQPSNTQGWISLTAGLASLASGIVTTVLVNQSGNAAVREVADRRHDGYRKVLVARDTLIASRFDYAIAKQRATETGLSPEEATKRLKEAQDALKLVVVAYKVLAQQSGACDDSRGVADTRVSANQQRIEVFDQHELSLLSR